MVEVEAQMPQATANIAVFDSMNRAVPSQLLSNDPQTHRVRFLLQSSVPGLRIRDLFCATRSKGRSSYFFS